MQYLDDEEVVANFFEQKERLATLLVQEEAFWKQRAKAFCLRDGDANTKFFHAITFMRKKRNLIRKLRSDEDMVVDDPVGMCEVGREFFLIYLQSSRVIMGMSLKGWRGVLMMQLMLGFFNLSL